MNTETYVKIYSSYFTDEEKANPRFETFIETTVSRVVNKDPQIRGLMSYHNPRIVRLFALVHGFDVIPKTDKAIKVMVDAVFGVETQPEIVETPPVVKTIWNMKVVEKKLLSRYNTDKGVLTLKELLGSGLIVKIAPNKYKAGTYDYELADGSAYSISGVGIAEYAAATFNIPLIKFDEGDKIEAFVYSLRNKEVGGKNYYKEDVLIKITSVHKNSIGFYVEFTETISDNGSRFFGSFGKSNENFVDVPIESINLLSKEETILNWYKIYLNGKK